MTWYTLSIFAIFTLTIYALVSKKFLNRPDSDPRVFGSLIQISTGTWGLIPMFISGFHFEFSWTLVYLFVGMFIAYTIAPSFYYSGLQKVDISDATILDSSVIIWAAIFGVLFLNEDPTLRKFIAITLIVLAILMITYRKGTHFYLNKYELMLIIAPIFYAIGSIFDNKILETIPAITYLPLSFIGAGTFMLLTNLYRIRKNRIPIIQNTQMLKVLAFGGLMLMLNYTAVFKAYEIGGEVSRVFPIIQIESVLIPLAGIVILKERDRAWIKILAAIIAFLGLIIIR